MSVQNDGYHIKQICNITPCEKHDAALGEPCWTLYVGASQLKAPAICGMRVRKAGFVGQIDPSSLSRGTRDNSKFKAPRRESSTDARPAKKVRN